MFGWFDCLLFDAIAMLPIFATKTKPPVAHRASWIGNYTGVQGCNVCSVAILAEEKFLARPGLAAVAVSFSLLPCLLQQTTTSLKSPAAASTLAAILPMKNWTGEVRRPSAA